MEEQIEKEKNYNDDLHKLYSLIIQINSMGQLTKEGWKIINRMAKDPKINYYQLCQF